MTMNKRGKSKIRINKGRLVLMLAVLSIVLATTNAFVSFAKYPEQYLPTWKYQLKNDLAKGNQEAIQYYNDTYVANGKQLFGDEFITNDGNGYFIEK